MGVEGSHCIPFPWWSSRPPHWYREDHRPPVEQAGDLRVAAYRLEEAAQRAEDWGNTAVAWMRQSLANDRRAWALWVLDEWSEQ